MNKRIKKLWVAALRSGKFRQAKGEMRERDAEGFAHCCLGVLESVRCSETGGKFIKSKFIKSKFNNVLAPRTMKWAGLDTNDPVLAPRAKTLASEMNDDGRSFSYIADRIEKYL